MSNELKSLKTSIVHAIQYYEQSVSPLPFEPRPARNTKTRLCTSNKCQRHDIFYSIEFFSTDFNCSCPIIVNHSSLFFSFPIIFFFLPELNKGEVRDFRDPIQTRVLS